MDLTSAPSNAVDRTVWTFSQKATIELTQYILFWQLLACIEMEIGLFIRRTLMVVLFCLWVPVKVMARTGNAGVSSSKPNVVNIGALYTFNSVIGRSAKPAIEAAVDDVNSDSTVLVGMNTHREAHSYI